MSGGFHIFRDDALLQEWESRVQCPRCSIWLYPDEVSNRVEDDNLCPNCAEIVHKRAYRLESCKRTWCPIDISGYIFKKGYHTTLKEKHSYQFRDAVHGEAAV